jgi:tRNA (cytidine/uridine-2'-O-)-methyltransferase
MSQFDPKPPCERGIRLALYQPDIPQNAGTLMRTCACLGVPLDIIEPAGFNLSGAALRRAGLDYLGHLSLQRHSSFGEFERFRQQRGLRLVLLTTRGETPYHSFAFAAGDVILAGRESAGVPDDVHKVAAARIRIPMRNGMRSMNVAVASALVLGEALRQTGAYSGLA